MYESLTVFETLFYAAQLRLPRHMTLAQKKERVNTVITALGLDSCKDTIIGGCMLAGRCNSLAVSGQATASHCTVEDAAVVTANIGSMPPLSRGLSHIADHRTVPRRWLLPEGHFGRRAQARQRRPRAHHQPLHPTAR
jgi:hypothetical protein